MDDRATGEIEARLSALRVAILERPTPGLGDARRRYDTRRRRPILLGVFVTGVAILVVSLLVYGVHQGGNPTPARPGAEFVLSQRIDKLAEQAAASSGDPRIAEVLWVATNAKAAAAMNGDSIRSTALVYLVEIPGSFTLNDVPGPPCSGAVTGRVEFLVINRSTFKASEGGVRESLDDLAKLGTVHVDRVRSGPIFPPSSETTADGSQTGNCSSSSERAAFVALARKGADGTFSATYAIPAQLQSVATVVTVAHLAPAGSGSPTSGSWMFEVDRVGTGDRFLWVSHPDSTAVCTDSSDSIWSCSQTRLTYPQGNGWLLATAFYLPLTEFGQIDGSNTDSTTSRQVVDGMPVVCLTDKVAGNGATLRWCVSVTGVLASFSAVPQRDGYTFGGSPTDGTITSESASASLSLFTLPARPGPWKGASTPPSH